ncbi:hypothetical protein [Krasilnikoviella flava]|nr:hypothetical protein [Krasilnikoviella flava]
MRTLRPVWVGAAALAVGTAGLGPAAATTGEADLPAPSVLSVNGEECGAEPLVTTLSSESYYTVRLDFAFDDAEVTTARVEVVEQDGDVRMNATQVEVRDGRGRVGLARGLYGIVEGERYTYRVRAVTSEGPSGQPVECAFSLRIGPRWPDVVPVLGQEALYPLSTGGGGVGIPGAFVAVPRVPGDAVAFEYGFTDVDGTLPTELTRIQAGADGAAEIPVVPTAPGTHFLMVVGVDADDVRGAWETRRFQVTAGSAVRPAPAMTLTEPADTLPADGRVPVDISLSADLERGDGEPFPMGEAVVRSSAGAELARTTFDATSERVLLDEAALGTGFRELQVEYRQFAGATPVVTTARICGGSCSFSGGKVSVASESGSKVTLATDLTAKVSGFSPAPASYTYQWLRDGKDLKGATKKDYLSVPTDQGHRLAVKVTARGERMTARSVTSSSVLVGDRDEMHANYGVKFTKFGWQSRFSYQNFSDGQTAGNAGGGYTVEMLSASPGSRAYSTSTGPTESSAMWFEMQGYVQGRGWSGQKSQKTDWVYYVGSIGEKRRLEAIRIDTAGPVSPYYDVFYRVYVPGRGWLGWATNGGTSGTIGYGSRIEAVQIKVLRHGKKPSASGSGNAPSYSRSTQKQVRVEPFTQPSKTWWSAAGGGTTAGWARTVGAPRRLNAVRVDVDGRYSGGVQVSAKVKGDGWRAYVGNDRTAGATRLDRPTSAYRMRLTGGMATHYRVYYRTYVQGVGWLGWAHDGAASGTASYAKRPTAVQVLLVPKGEAAPRSGYGRSAYRR